MIPLPEIDDTVSSISGSGIIQ